jgi:hypothetical protein
LRRRPVIESVDAKDLIVSNDATDLDGAGRVTHVIRMSPGIFRRMQLAGAYREVSLSHPEASETTLDRKLNATQGVEKSYSRPEDQERVIYECHCDFDIPGFEHEIDGEHSGLPLPYKITLDKASRKVLAIRRNWREDDDDCKKRRVFVMYPFVPMFGFYPSGLVHFLGNTTNALTASWRIVLDNGIFNNFPAFLYNKGGAKSDTPNFRVSPGTGIAIDSISGRLQDSVMPIPYKETNPAFTQFIGEVSASGQRLGGTAETNVAEGKQNAPVGTTLALIEQATKVMSAVHKRLHTAQAEEFEMLRELLQEDPEALWRHRRDGKRPANADAVITALDNYDLVPASDPNSPSQMARQLRAVALAQRSDAHPERYNPMAIEEEVMRSLGVNDFNRFLVDPSKQQQQPPAPDPKIVTALVKAKSDEANRQVDLYKANLTAQVKEKDRDARRQEKTLDVMKHIAVHPQSLEQIPQDGNIPS